MGVISAEGGLLVGLLIAIVSWAASGQTQQNFGPCSTAEGEPGKCIHLEECTKIYTLFKKPRLTSSDIRYLKSTQCGSVNRREILVCCSEEEVQETPDTVELPSAERRQCGRVDSDRIIGGTATKFDEYPWMVLLEYKRRGRLIGHKCGGSLINKRYVLTAAHCIAPTKPFKVRLGEWDTSTDPDCVLDSRNRADCAEPHMDVDVEQTIVHPRYQRRSRNQHFDIALIRLDRDIESSYFVQPICLPPEDAFERDSSPDQIVTIAGWGKTENKTNSVKKLKLEIPVISSADCQATYGRRVSIISTQICAGGAKGQDSCSGDSGGPMMALDKVNNKQYAYLAGVVSYGPTPCGMEGYPGVYTKVSEFKEWILENMKP